MFLGLLVATALVVAMQLPLRHQPALVHQTLTSVIPHSLSVPPLAWPSIGSGALVIPALGVVQSWRDHVAPVASLTKMMTAYVTLRHLPLAVGQVGPCHVVTASDVVTYVTEKTAGESGVVVVAGERLCEIDLLKGLLVHSAGNYAAMLASMVAGSRASFVSLMNVTAKSLDLRRTHYDDVSGFSALSVSTALDQVRMAVELMKSPVVQSIVRLPNVTLPVAGSVGSFTPLVGTNNVVGVKSGRTSPAGGCDVMAMTFQQGGATRIIYAAVLGQRGGDLLGPAGRAALALAQSALRNRIELVYPQGSVVGRIGWTGRTVDFGFARQSVLTWWAPRARPAATIQMLHFTTTIHRGEVVGWVTGGGSTRRLALVAQGTVAPPSLWQRLR